MSPTAPICRTHSTFLALAAMLALATPASTAPAELAALESSAAPGSSTAPQAGTAPVRVWEETVVIPTYPLGPDDLNPHFFELGGSIIYPYTMQDSFTTDRVDRAYRVMVLENEYLRVMCLPEIGGRIQSVYDKAAQQEMFYRNGVIRPGHIALRGAWVSGGIEWNRGPQGHTVTSFSPVDVRGVQNSDGSATLVIGNVEQNFRTGWEVRLTLHPGERVLDERIRLFNPTDGFHPYYFWNNTAFPNRPGTRFIFPMSLGSDHDGKAFFSWPEHEGRDLTWLRNYPEPTSVFGYRVDFDFFGAYDVDRDYGIVAVSDHHLLPGKKAWTWGQADSGLVAQSVLTDADGPYIEVQSGPLPTQADFAMLVPGQEVSWQEWWYPVNGLGRGFEYASRHVAVERIDRGTGIELRFASSANIDDARLEIDRQDGRVERRRVNLEAARTASVVLETGSVTDSSTMGLNIRLEAPDGTSLLDYRSPLSIPDRVPPAPEAIAGDSAEALFLRGYGADLRSDRVTARELYESALRLEPMHTRSLLQLAALDLEAGLDEAAAAGLETLLQLDDSDGMAWVLAGAARLRRGDLEGAASAGYEAVKRSGTVALGYGLVGRARARRGDYAGAVDALTAGLTAGGGDWTRLYEHILLATYGAGDRETAVSLARQAIASGTTRLAPRAIVALSATEDLARFAQEARQWVGEPEFAFLELANEFADMGLLGDAAQVLEATTVDVVPAGRRRPLPLYWLAWLHQQLGDDETALQWLQLASSTRGDRTFPSRPESVAVLRFATRQQPGDAQAHELLGNLYAGLGRLEEAEASWRRAAELDTGVSVPRRNLGRLAWQQAGDLDTAARWYQEAWTARPDDQTLPRDLARIRLAQQRPADAVVVLESVPATTARRADVTLLLARAYVAVARFDDAVALLDATTFTNREGDTGTWQVFHDAHVRRGEAHFEAGDTEAALADFEAALTYPPNLNSGRPYRPLEARAQWWRGLALQRLGRSEEARKAWTACVSGAPANAEQEEHIERCRVALEGQG